MRIMRVYSIVKFVYRLQPSVGNQKRKYLFFGAGQTTSTNEIFDVFMAQFAVCQKVCFKICLARVCQIPSNFGLRLRGVLLILLTD